MFYFIRTVNILYIKKRGWRKSYKNNFYAILSKETLLYRLNRALIKSKRHKRSQLKQYDKSQTERA